MLESFDRRSAARSALFVNVQFLLRGQDEHKGALLDMSESGAAIITNAKAERGDETVMHIERVGRLKGHVARTFKGGFAVHFELCPGERRSMRERIVAATAGRAYFRLCDVRQSVRVKYDIETALSWRGLNKPVACRLADLSQTGCYLVTRAAPPIGTRVTVGKFDGLVVRHGEDGVGVDFFWSDADICAFETQQKHDA